MCSRFRFSSNLTNRVCRVSRRLKRNRFVRCRCVVSTVTRSGSFRRERLLRSRKLCGCISIFSESRPCGRSDGFIRWGTRRTFAAAVPIPPRGPAHGELGEIRERRTALNTFLFSRAPVWEGTVTTRQGPTSVTALAMSGLPAGADRQHRCCGVPGQRDRSRGSPSSR